MGGWTESPSQIMNQIIIDNWIFKGAWEIVSAAARPGDWWLSDVGASGRGFQSARCRCQCNGEAKEGVFVEFSHHTRSRSGQHKWIDHSEFHQSDRQSQNQSAAQYLHHTVAPLHRRRFRNSTISHIPYSLSVKKNPLLNFWVVSPFSSRPYEDRVVGKRGRGGLWYKDVRDTYLETFFISQLTCCLLDNFILLSLSYK